MESKLCRVTTLRGLGKSAEKGELSAVRNMSADAFPYLKTRGRRSVIRRMHQPQGLFSDGTLAYVDGGRLYYGGYEIEGIFLSEGEKTVLRLGEYLLVFPDGIYYNIGDGSDYGTLSVTNTADGGRICCVDTHFTELDCSVVTQPPDEAAVGAHCAIKMSDGSLKIKRYNGVYWYDVDTLIKLEAEGIGNGIRVGDTVSLTGAEAIGSCMTVAAREPSALYCVGAVASEILVLGSITVRRRIPIFDLVTVSGGRLCGVRRGRDLDGRVVCRMYLSRENDPFVFLPEGGGAELDLDLSGVFTGLCDHMGSPVAFTEGEIVETRIKGGGLIATVVRGFGVMQGAQKSIASLDGSIYYLSPVGICRYDGSYPECIHSSPDGLKRSVGGSPAVAAKGKYYINLTDKNSLNAIYIYDIKNKRIVTEDPLHATALVKRRESVYALSADGELVLLDRDSASEPDYLLSEDAAQDEDEVYFYAETPDIGLADFGSVSPVRVTLRVKKPSGTALRVAIRYNGCEAEEAVELKGEIDGLAAVPIPVKRCESFRLIISGEGDVTIGGYSVEYRSEGAVLWR